MSEYSITMTAAMGRQVTSHWREDMKEIPFPVRSDIIDPVWFIYKQNLVIYADRNRLLGRAPVSVINLEGIERSPWKVFAEWCEVYFKGEE